MRVMRRKRAREMRGMEHWRVDGGLQIEAENDVRKEELERPLILLIAPGSAERDPWLALTQREGRAERSPRTFAALDAVGVVRIQVEHLRSRAKAKTQAVDDRRALQPASAGSARDQVSVTISDRHVNRVAAYSSGRLGPGACPVTFGDNLGRAPRKQRLFAVECAGPELK